VREWTYAGCQSKKKDDTTSCGDLLKNQTREKVRIPKKTRDAGAKKGGKREQIGNNVQKEKRACTSGPDKKRPGGEQKQFLQDQKKKKIQDEDSRQINPGKNR